jgi:hypothetical protein
MSLTLRTRSSKIAMRDAHQEYVSARLGYHLGVPYKRLLLTFHLGLRIVERVSLTLDQIVILTSVGKYHLTVSKG